MKRFPYVPDQVLLEMDGTNAKDPQGEQIVWNQFSFLCGRVADPVFGSGKPGLEALRFALATQTLLSEQKEAANNRGFWMLEDEPATCLQRATKSPASPYEPRWTLTLMKYCDPIDNEMRACNPDGSPLEEK